MKSIIEIIKKYTAFLTRLIKEALPYKSQLFVVIFLNSFSSLIGVGLALASKNLVDSAVAVNMRGAAIAAAFFVGLVITNLALSSGLSLLSVRINEAIGNDIRRKYFKQIAETSWLDLSKYHSGDLLTRLTSDTDVLVDTITGTIPATIALLVQLIGAFFVLYFMEPKLAVFAFALTPIIMILSRVWAKKLKQYHKEMQSKEGEYRSFMQEALQNITK